MQITVDIPAKELAARYARESFELASMLVWLSKDGEAATKVEDTAEYIVLDHGTDDVQEVLEWLANLIEAIGSVEV